MKRFANGRVRAVIGGVIGIALWGHVVLGVEPIPLDEVKRGMRGTCVTEMDGGEIVTVPVEVIGVLQGVGPEAEMIIVRLQGARFQETGIIAGMSGSPVYVDGRLLGALAFGWQFAKAPIGGVTPFERMQSLAREPSAEASRARTARPDLEELVAVWMDAQRSGPDLLDWLLPEETAARDLVGVPLAVSGPAPGGWLAEAWQRLGWAVPTTAAVGGSIGAGTEVSVDAGEAEPLRPGSMVATIMVDGDALLAAGGTVTEVDGNQVWAFGHPNLGLGSTAMPLARAEVMAVLPSLASSFKFFAVGERVGTVRQDRERGAWGVLGPVPEMVPVTVQVNGRTYRYGVISDPVLQPLLLAYVTNASHRARGRQLGEQTVTCEVELTLDDGSTLRLEETYASGDAPALASSLVSAVSAYLMNSPHRETLITSAAVRLDGRERVDRAVIEQVQPMQRRARRGETVELVIRVRPHRAAPETVRVEVKIPEWVAAGNLDVVVADGAAWTQYDLRMRPTPVRSFADELKVLGRIRPSTELVVVLEQRELGLTLPGGTVSVPPTIAVGLSRAGLPAAQTQYAVVHEQARPMPWSLTGAYRIRLTVDDGELTEEGS
jgi:hypothetical protein